MVDQTTLVQKRAEAAAYAGVTYDCRIDRFTAAITVRGERRHLGSFQTAGEASIVYEQARENDPIERPRHGSSKSIKQLMVAFEETARRGDDKKFLPGQFFTTPDGQKFRLEGMSRQGKSSRYVWSSRCKICGALYEHNSTMFVRAITGMTRTCETHRGKLGRIESHDWPDPIAWNSAPRIFDTRAATLRAAKKASGALEPLDSLREGSVLWAFGKKWRERDPTVSLSKIRERYLEYTEEDAKWSSSARFEDAEALAEDSVEQTASNEDLL